MINPPFSVRNLSLLALLLSNVFDVQAAPETYNYNLPAQPAANTLDQISRTSKTQLIYVDKTYRA
jgi:hypothetical protein